MPLDVLSFLESPFLFPPLLPPGFRLHSVCKSVGSILERNSTNKSAQSIRPVRVGHVCPEHGAAEEFSSRPNLRSNRELAQPSVISRRNVAVRVIEPSFARQREVLGEEHFRPRSERDPLLPRMLWVAIFRALVNEDRHDGEPVIRLEQYLFGEQKPRGAVDEAGRVVNGRAEIASWACTILDSK